MDDLAPHTAFVQVSYEIHQKRPDGKFEGTIRKQGRIGLQVDGQDFALCEHRLERLLQFIKEQQINGQAISTEGPATSDSEILRRSKEEEGTRPFQARVPRSSERGRTSVGMLGMRPAITEDSGDGTGDSSRIPVPGGLSPLR